MPMRDGLGAAAFAPTAENAMEAAERGASGLDGLPAAIKILSLRMPKFAGARGLAPDALLQGQGAGGVDPFASTVMQTLLATLMGGSGTPSPNITPGITGPIDGGLEDSNRSWQDRAAGGIGNTGRPRGPLEEAPGLSGGGNEFGLGVPRRIIPTGRRGPFQQ